MQPWEMRVGQRVTWAEDLPEKAKKVQSQIGEGPFIILEISCHGCGFFSPPVGTGQYEGLCQRCASPGATITNICNVIVNTPKEDVEELSSEWIRFMHSGVRI